MSWLKWKIFDLALWYVCRYSKNHRRLEEFLDQNNSFETICAITFGYKELQFSFGTNKEKANQAKEFFETPNPFLETLNKYSQSKEIDGGATIGSTIKWEDL